MIRLYARQAAPGRLVVTGPQLHYISHVLRLTAGSALELFDGRGQAFAARVIAVGPESAELELSAPRTMPPARPISIVQGLPKADKLELILQKGTELGAARFVPVSTARSVVKLERNVSTKLIRWRRVIEEAARQCRRNDLPELVAPTTLLEGVDALPDQPQVFVLDEEEHALPLSSAFEPLRDSARPVAIVIGPEGGLTRDEVKGLHERGGISVTLGSLILRTETAALAALTVLRHLDGLLG